jgi:hypothetical protein
MSLGYFIRNADSTPQDNKRKKEAQRGSDFGKETMVQKRM